MKKIFITIFILSILSVNVQALTTADIKLPEFKKNVNTDLIYALYKRKSIRKFSETKKINLEDLSTVLWAANGINRKKNGGHTAPLAYDKEYMHIYVFSDTSVHLYQPKEHKLKFIKSGEFKGEVAHPGFVEEAQYVLVFIADISELPFYVGWNTKKLTGFANSGCLGQNVYLIANALNLATCYVGYIDADNITEILELNESEIPTNVMPLSYPKEK